MLQLAANATAGYIGLFFFLSFFAVVVALLLKPGAKAVADKNALIPFKEE